MGIGGNGGDVSGSSSGGGRVTRENSGVYGGSIFEGYGLVGSVFEKSHCSYCWFLILAIPFFVSVNVFALSEASTSNVFFSKKSNLVVGGINNEPFL